MVAAVEAENIFCTWKAKRKHSLLNSNNNRKENVNVKLPSELHLSPSALPLSTRPYDVTRVAPHDTLSLWRALTTPWQRAQKTSAATAATNSATLHHRQQQHHNSPHQQPHTAMAGGLAHPTRYIPSPLHLLHATLYPCVHGGHVVSGLSANGSCTDEVQQKSAVVTADESIGVPPSWYLFFSEFNKKKKKDVVRLNWKYILRKKGLLIFILENHRGTERLACKLTYHTWESKCENASFQPLQVCFNGIDISFCCFWGFSQFKKNWTRTLG